MNILFALVFLRAISDGKTKFMLSNTTVAAKRKLRNGSSNKWTQRSSRCVTSLKTAAKPEAFHAWFPVSVVKVKEVVNLINFTISSFYK